MFLLSEPTAVAVESFLHTQQGEAFSYSEVGASRIQSPSGYKVDHNRALLGLGVETFNSAVKAIQTWQMFNVGWCRISPLHAPIKVGTTVVIVINHFGFWSLNACRIVYLIEDTGMVERYGFAYGTLPQHGEVGEERFSVELRREDNSVWYDLYAFSSPGPLIAKLGYPLSRMLQKRFARDSKAAMVKAVGDGPT